MRRSYSGCVSEASAHEAGSSRAAGDDGTNAVEASQTVAQSNLLWKHVYNPSRLQVVNSCIAATGVIEESNADDDGDQHLLLKLDPGQDRLLKKKNLKKKGGDLVVEIVCANRVRLMRACGS